MIQSTGTIVLCTLAFTGLDPSALAVRAESSAQHAARSEQGERAMLRSPREVPQIVLLTAPAWVEIDRPFDIAVTAADRQGLAAIELEFDGQVVSIPGHGQKLLSGVATFQARPGALHELRGVAIGIDGRTRSAPSIRSIVSGPNDVGPSLATERDYFNQLADPGYPARTGALQNQHVGPQVGMVPTLTDGRPWWIRWTNAHGPKPFDWQAACGPGIAGGDPQGITPLGEVLDCWLALHPKVTASIVWDELDANAGPVDEFNVHVGVVTQQPYAAWTDDMRTELHVAFYHAWDWMHGGLDTFNGEYLPPVPDNVLAPLGDHDSPKTTIDRDVAWKLYLGTIAQSLALEHGGFVPRRITAYSPDDLSVLFNSASMFVPGNQRWFLADNTIRSATGYFVEFSIAAPPTMNFAFMVSADMIRPTQYQTVGRYLDWGRDHVFHTGIHLMANNVQVDDGSDAISAESYWGYRGTTPAARVIDPPPTDYNDQLSSWVIGCPAMSRFTQQLLRAVNIPAQAGSVGQTLHTVPLFWTIGYTMSHGDDMYDARFFKSTPPFPASRMLIPMATFNDWFYGAGQLGPNGSANVGRQLIEIALQYLPDDLVQSYCADKDANLSHANGSVAAYFRNDYYGVTFYTPAQLSAKGLWTKLGVKAAAMGVCGP